MILCSGEALVDMLPRTTTGGEEAFAPYAGGSVFNTAIALGRLGVPTGFYSGISNDLFGQMLEKELLASNVDVSLADRSDRPTTLAIVTLTDGQARYLFYDENTAGRMLTPDVLPKIPDEITACFFGGISLAVEPCAAAYEAFMTKASGQCVIMIDPNIRPGFIADEARYRDRIGKMIAMADIVKVSDEDMHWLEGDGALEDLAKGMMSRGPAMVFVTEGSKGVTGYSGEQSVFVPAPKVDVADTVGAGDTFNAGALAAFHKAGVLEKTSLRKLNPETLRAALTLGAEAAAVTVSRAGANPPWADEL